MKTLDVLTKQELTKEYKLRPNYIKQHAAAMGGHGKPLLFDRERVELYLREQFWGELAEREGKAERSRDLKEFIDQRVRSIQSAASTRAVNVPAELNWRGGRKKISQEVGR